MCAGAHPAGRGNRGARLLGEKPPPARLRAGGLVISSDSFFFSRSARLKMSFGFPAQKTRLKTSLSDWSSDATRPGYFAINQKICVGLGLASDVWGDPVFQRR